MRRYWYPEAVGEQTHLVLEEELFHHICDVCRQGQGSKFELISPDGFSRLVEIEQLNKRQALLKILSTQKSKALKPPHIHLCISLPKLPTFESVLEKSVELGVAHIHPFISDFSFFKSAQKVSEDRMERWQRIVVSATQQSGRGELMQVHPVVNFENIVDQMHRAPASMCLFAYEGSTPLGLKSYLTRHLARPEGEASIQDVWLVVGSEGGFSDSEVFEMKSRKLEPVTMGDQVLRVETACISLVSVLKYELGLMEA